MRLLDIGGGFPGNDDAQNFSLQKIADAIRPVLDQLFDDSVSIISEPGRYFACASHILCCNVYARRALPKDDPRTPEFLYYTNDGVYGSFNCILFDHVSVFPKIVKPRTTAAVDDDLKKASEEEPVDVVASAPPSPSPPPEKYLCTLFGPTCDSMDCICKNIYLPELQVGDWIYFDNFGAYTLAAGSAFNGFKTTKQFYIMRL